MSIVQTRSSKTAAAATTSPLAGLYLNPGITMGEGDDGKFVRLPRGVALEDLKTRKIYDNMDADFAAEVEIMNEVINALHEAGLPLKEGESVSVNLECRIYRRMEGVEAPVNTEVKSSVHKALFG
jgi:hypothetical protein